MKKTYFLEAKDLTEKQIRALVRNYPNGYDYTDIQSVVTDDGKRIKAIKLEEQNDLVYVKVSIALETLLDKNAHLNDIKPSNFDTYFDEYL